MADNSHYKNKIYYAWASMKTRCNNKKYSKADRYSKRGITYCERWEDYKNFYEDMGKDYQEGLSLGRINNDGNYEPANCRWENDFQQANNKSNNKIITFNNKTQTLPEWAKELGIKSGTLRQRLYTYKWSIEKCLTYSQ